MMAWLVIIGGIVTARHPFDTQLLSAGLRRRATAAVIQVGVVFVHLGFPPADGVGGKYSRRNNEARTNLYP
jgi:hypothetical protein